VNALRKIRFGIVGAGAIAQQYAQAFRSCDEAEVVAVTDVREDAARALAESFGCQAFASYQALAERSKPEAVLICTPPVSHPKICLFFIERKVPVLCEKPFAIGVGETVRVLEAARKNRVSITMASKFRYVPDVVEAKRIVDSGIVGEIVLFENAFASRVDMSKRWNSDPAISGGGVLIDNGTHSLDLARHFLGPLAEVLAIEGPRRPDLDVEDTVSVFVRSTKGVIGTVDLSWTINKELDRYISIFGSRGAVLVGWKESKYRQLDARGWITFGSGYDKIGAFRAQLTNFARAIKGEETLLVGPEDILGSVRVVEAAYDSMRRSHWTPVNGARQFGRERRKER
jgi:predicted dehydrogenase